MYFLFQEEEVDEEEVYEEGEEDAGEGMDEEGEGNAWTMVQNYHPIQPKKI